MHRSTVLAHAVTLWFGICIACSCGPLDTPPAISAQSALSDPQVCLAKMRLLEPPQTGPGEDIPREKMTPPRLIEGSEHPEFPKLDITGSDALIIVQCAIHIDGTVSNCRFICSVPHLEKDVLANLLSRKYIAAIYRGQSVEVSYTFKFHIRSGEVP